MALPDLTVGRTMDVSPKYCVFGVCLPYDDEVALTTIVSNIGAGPSSATEVDVNGSRRGVPALAPGATVRIHWPVQDCGFFMITVDPDNLVHESNEGNNWLQAECA